MEIFIFLALFGIAILVITSKIRTLFLFGQVGSSMFSAFNYNKRLSVEYPNIILSGLLPKKIPVQNVSNITITHIPLYQIGKAGPILPTFGKEKLNQEAVQFTEAEIGQAFQAGAQTGLLIGGLQEKISQNISQVTVSINNSARENGVTLINSVTMKIALQNGQTFSSSLVERTPGEISALLQQIKGTGIQLIEKNLTN